MKYTTNIIKKGILSRYCSNTYGMQYIPRARYFLTFCKNEKCNTMLKYQPFSTSKMSDNAHYKGEDINKMKSEKNEENKTNENSASSPTEGEKKKKNNLNESEEANEKKEEINYEDFNKIDLINEIKKTKKDMEEKMVDNKVLKEKYLSVLAENENLRNRYMKEIETSKLYCISNFAKSLLDVADNLSLAIKNINEESLKTNEEINNIYKGIEMTETILHNIFNKYGIDKYNPINEKFNPQFHEAIFEINDSTKEKGTVATVIQHGYKIKDRILRAAKVGVVKN
ncbi:GrpE protein homolog, mitochondrial, putative [Plasmodium sp. gorilla clade G2]|uniref:GrpE protein homolog, mitochondrial, putative n=1 Tax=Plasmodium sp. gorilla clade G2 TaxID=880535 RepID=UPI000D20DE97|nr:GrpE protein homolog, mitochondrial, putative [Plasmodium sp. gorilla clade G2]SOV15702.1 GrpE protein homolog, mitochondrial, putative [Plasmodium sp. gorilla clade G2]